MILEEKIVLSEKNIGTLLKCIKPRDDMSDTWIYIRGSLANELARTADKDFEFEGIQEIKWIAKSNSMGFLDLEPKCSIWRKVYRINDGTPVFTEEAVIPSKIIWIE